MRQVPLTGEEHVRHHRQDRDGEQPGDGEDGEARPAPFRMAAHARRNTIRRMVHGGKVYGHTATAARCDSLSVHRGAARDPSPIGRHPGRSEEHTSELQSLMRISYAVFCLKKKKLYSLFEHTFMLIIC